MTHRHRWQLFPLTIRMALAACLALTITSQFARALEHDKPFGEPYELLGKRIVFTTWYYVRPGQSQWYDPKTGTRWSATPSLADAHWPRSARLLGTRAC